MRETTRDTLVVKLPLHDRVIQRLQADPNIRVMLFGAADNTGLNPFYNNDIAFPHQVELKVNLDEVKANLRGLKNKPGTTRPVDITSYLRKVAKYENEIRLTYALTHKVGIPTYLCSGLQAQPLFPKRSPQSLTRPCLNNTH